MKSECPEFDRLLAAAIDEGEHGLESHAAACESCAARLVLWREIPVLAGWRHREWESPGHWPRIRRALAAEQERRDAAVGRPFARLLQSLAVQWRPLAAGFLLGAIALAGALGLFRSREASVGGRSEPTTQEVSRLLSEAALADVERHEAAYIASIAKLSQLAAPRLANPASEKDLAWRERLLFIDGAITACRESIEQNRFNAHLRRELLAVYQEKQHTLEQLIREN